MFEGDDYIGRPANVAARLCDLAEAGQTLATREVASQAPRWVAVGPFQALPIHGLDRPVETAVLCLAEGTDGAETTVDPCCGLTLPVQRGLETRFGADGTVHRFCSPSCAVAWEDSQIRPRSPLEAASPTNG
jgi:hypothetical protein